MRRWVQAGLAAGALFTAQPAPPPRHLQSHPLHPVSAAPVQRFSPASGLLNLTGYRLVFEDRFQRLDITADGGGGRWFAPVHSDFGRAHFLAPTPEGPFLTTPGGPGRPMLAIRATRGPDGWTSGLMQTVDGRGRGFAQRYGYFEMRARLPKGPGTWPAFWLLTQQGYTDHTVPRGEIDVIEQYGLNPDRLHMSVHLWPAYDDDAGGLPDPWTLSKRINLPGLSEGFHAYGVMIDARWVSFYYDRRALTRFPTLPTYRTPLYMLVDLAMHKRALERAHSPDDLVVDDVQAWSRTPADG